MKELVITCRIKDWLDYRWGHIGGTEIALVKFKIYEGIFNLSWKDLKDSDELVKFFRNRDAIISIIEGSKLTQNGFNCYDELIKYAPSLKGTDIVYTEKEVC